MIVPGYGLAVAQAGAIVADIALHLRKQVCVVVSFVYLVELVGKCVVLKISFMSICFIFFCMNCMSGYLLTVICAF